MRSALLRPAPLRCVQQDGPEWRISQGKPAQRLQRRGQPREDEVRRGAWHVRRQGLPVSMQQVVEDDYLMTCVYQLFADHAANVSGSAGDQNIHV